VTYLHPHQNYAQAAAEAAHAESHLIGLLVLLIDGTVTIMVLANALSYQNASGPFNNGPTELT